ncbi:RHS repeat-associated protein [Anaerobacterium chartisolvens]|uniref:RHS repeat-associated protein n=1 Tax=Anaerobacterium chartisolvens TaxID=1297424 RepID=A0A369BB63_9FIRM|nr:RHS repeat-associated core domain-containing protein [Anaerobacterium chartisolvens]RCX18763.1 RHS repeat-associated protein [Anaerobacterium chartisolvens]
MKRHIFKIFAICVITLITVFIQVQGVLAETLEERLNNLVGPAKQYNTMLSPAYLRNNATEESISPQSGDISLVQTDYVLPGINGLDLEIKRMYRSGTANVQEMKAEYVNGAWVDQVYSDNKTSSFYEDRYDLGVGMRFSFPAMEIKKNSDGTSHRFLHTEAGDVYRLMGPESVDNVNTYKPENQTIKDVTVKENKGFSNGQTDGTSFYMMEGKDGRRTYFADDGRVLGIRDRYGNTITFLYTSVPYTVDGTDKSKKLISKIIDTAGRETAIEYKQDESFTAGAIEDKRYGLEDSHMASQNPDTTHSGDLKGKFQVIITLPGNKKLVYDKSAVLLSKTNHILRTRLQRVYDVDGKPKYHYWYDQPQLGFTYTNGKQYSAYNRYENLTQIDYCKTNRLERFTYSTCTKGLSDKGSMQYRKIFEKSELARTGYDASKTEFLDRFAFNIKDRTTYKYTNEADGFGYEGYKESDQPYLRDTYRYYTDVTVYDGTVLRYTYDGLHQHVGTEETGSGHKRTTVTEYDEMKFPKKTEKTVCAMENGNVKGRTVKTVENFRYDDYGNLTNYTGPMAERDDNGYPADSENTVVYSYAYDRFHVLSLKTWKQDKDTTCQTIYTIDDMGNVVKEQRVNTGDAALWLETDYEYDSRGNMTGKTVHSDGNLYVTRYEYGTDDYGTDHKGAYLTKQYRIAGGEEAVIRYAYDFNTGSLKSETDARSNITAYEYDILGRVTRIANADGSVSKYVYGEYRDKDRNIEYTDAVGNRVRYRYDIFGNQLTHEAYSEGGWQLINEALYNFKGSKTKERDSNGHSIRYSYDSENRLTKKEYYENDAARKESILLAYTYGGDGGAGDETLLLVTMTDEDGYKHRLYYDKLERLVRTDETPDGNTYYTTTCAYDYAGNKVSDTDPRGHTTQYRYNALGQLESVSDAVGGHTLYTYNGLEKPDTITEPEGKATKYIYDGMGRTKEERIYQEDSPESYTYTRYTYDRSDNIETIVRGSVKDGGDSVSSSTRYAYDKMNRLVGEYAGIDASVTSRTEYKYDNNGNRTEAVQYIDAQGAATIKHICAYDYAGRMIIETGVMSAGTGDEQGSYMKKFRYDHAGSLTEEQRYNGTSFDTTSYRYDYRGRLVEKTQPLTPEGDVKTTSYTYDKRGNVLSETVAFGGEARTTQYKYDGMGRNTAKIDPMGYITRHLYDENGNLIKEIDARYSSQETSSAPGTGYEYDALNRQILTSVFDSTSSTVISYREYDGRGNVIKEADGDGYSSDNPAESIGNTYKYDARNNVIVYTSAQASKDGSEHTMKYTYDGSGNVLTEEDALGRVTQNTYYLNGLLKKKTYPDGLSESYAYDLTGRVKTVKTDRAGNKTSSYSNLFGKAYRIEYPDNTSETFRYNARGELAESRDREGSAKYFEYDLQSNVTEKKEYISTGAGYDRYRLVKNTYDGTGSILTSETFEYTVPKGSVEGGQEKPAGDRVEYTYDKNGRLIRVMGPMGKETANEYDRKGNLITRKQKVRDGYYRITRYQYDIQSRLISEALLAETSELDTASLGKAVLDSEYTTRVKLTTFYSYYSSGQLKAKTSPNGGTASYEYDLDGRPVRKTDAMGYDTMYIYDTKGNLIEEKNARNISVYYEYDSMDRLIRKKSSAADGGLAVTRYIYDAAGNLKNQIQPNSYTVETDTPELAGAMEGMSYTYDSMNRRTSTLSPEGEGVEYLKYSLNGNVAKRVDGLRFAGSIDTSPGTIYTYDGLGRVTDSTDALGGSRHFEYDVLGSLTKMTDERGNVTTYQNNPDGTLAKITYPDGGQVEYAYDSMGRKVLSRDQLGSTTLYEWNSLGSIKLKTDALGNTLEYKSDAEGNITASKDKLGSWTYISYDTANRPVKKRIPIERDANGNILYRTESYSYDELGSVTGKTVSGTGDRLSSRTVSYTYWDNGLVSTVTDSGGAYTKSWYDKNGNTIKTESLRTEGVYSVRRLKYDSMDRLTASIDRADEDEIHNAGAMPGIESLRDAEYPGRLMLITEYGYDVLGNRISETSPMAFAYGEGQQEQRQEYTVLFAYDALNRLEKVTRRHEGRDICTLYAYDESGNRIKETDERGFETTHSYDSMNRLVSSADSEGGTIAYGYDIAGNRISQTDAKGNTMEYGYDSLGRVQTVTDAYGIVISTSQYDVAGNVVKETDAKGHSTLYAYNPEGRLIRKSSPEAAAQGKYTAEYRYDQYGQLIRQTNGLGNATAYEYDSAGNLTRVTDALGISTRYTYDRLGSKLTMTDGRGKLTRYGYGAAGFLTKVTDAEGRDTAYKYSLDGNTASIRDRNGNTTVFSYDSRGLMLERKVQETGDVIKYTYDEAGNRASMEDGSGTSTYNYDGNGRLLEIRKGGSLQISYTYDIVGNIESVTDKKGFATRYGYDKSNRLESVAYGGNTTSYAYDENGNRRSIDYGGGLREEYSFDMDNRLVELKNLRPDGGSISRYSYSYDLAGRQVSKTDSYGTTEYQYDGAGRIIRVTAPGKTTVYAYDRGGNRVSQNEAYTSVQPMEYIDESIGKDIQFKIKKSEYTYSASNTLLKLVERMYGEDGKELAQKTTRYEYDTNGNQLNTSISYIMRDNTGLSQGSRGSAYGDSIEVGVDSLLERTGYVYDGFNRLTTAETVKSGVRSIARYTYDGDDLRVSKTVRRSDNENRPEVTQYLYDRQHVILETDADNGIKVRYVRGVNYIARLDSSNEASYFMYNGHGDVVQTVNAAGEVQNSYDYDIWGNPTLTVEEYACAIRYAGEFMDAETGLYYLRARYYDPYVGRFISEDSYWGEDSSPLSLNRYTYCENDPVNYIDPTGHLKQGDEKLTQSAQLQIVELTKQWYAASTQAEKQKITNKANAIRNESGNIARVSESSHNSSFYSGFSSSISDGSSMSKSEWNSIANNFYVQGSVTVSSGVSISNINVRSGTSASITNSGSIGSIITGTQSSTSITNYGSISSITTGIGSSTAIKNSGTIGSISTGSKSSTSIVNNWGILVTDIGSGATANIQNNGSMLLININNPKSFNWDAQNMLSGIPGINIGGSGSIGGISAYIGNGTDSLRFDMGSVTEGRFDQALRIQFMSSAMSAEERFLTEKLGQQWVRDVIALDSRFEGVKVGFDGQNVTINGLPLVIDAKTTLNGKTYANPDNIWAALDSYWYKYIGIGNVTASQVMTFEEYLNRYCSKVGMNFENTGNSITAFFERFGNALVTDDPRVAREFSDEMGGYFQSFFEGLGSTLLDPYGSIGAIDIDISNWINEFDAANDRKKIDMLAAITNKGLWQIPVIAATDGTVKVLSGTVKTWGVDPTMQAADETAGVLKKGSYVKNPTAQNINSLIKEGSNYVGNSRFNGQYMYVVDPQGNIIIGSRGGQHMPHPTLIGGSNPQVQAAGIVEIRGGKIYKVDNASGHFKPGAGSLDAAQGAFSKLPSNVFSKDFQGYVPYGK